MSAARFRLGAVVITPGADAALRASRPDLDVMLGRHLSGRWGELPDDDKAANDAALEHGGRLLSCYRTDAGERVWIITEADRSATTVLLPEEY